ncbi:hypothetical protein EOD42_05490 [Rhodovarius crocodyli]|uniref:Lipoprotein n=1 Tax=Rhodovarius crocodyli TaxID=1979269 RepID=A0A437MPH7_9PROT|nr:hypothetical protein [Rhodovarius crocodyli]RVT99539.1 hypothetical protein EOD42_05490 [Rhodovarius crocodyli]
MKRRRALLAPLALAPLLLAACSNNPGSPLWGNPGRNARRLAVPLAIRVAVPTPTGALLDARGAEALAEAVAAGLQAEEIPAVRLDTPLPLDWRLEITAVNNGAAVVPRFALVNADGASQGQVDGAPVPTAVWAMAQPPALEGTARQAAPGVARLLLSIQAARAAGTADAISGGTPRIRFLPVTGAPGDGPQALAGRMREFMANLGYVVQDGAQGAQYGLTAAVRVDRPANGKQVVDLQWIVTRLDGQELGRVVQVEEVDAGRLDRFWGDIAYVAAEQASGGVMTIIRNAASPTTPVATPASR